ncbi:MAG: hypothetical protein RIT28_1206 [Pseudomonadota bacterium]|jgi:prevent-host-death family protein
MSAAWKLTDATSRFDEVVAEALSVGPQTVTRQGEPVVVVVDVETWRRLSAANDSLKDYLLAAPLEGVFLEREQDEPRETDLP